ncbi:hypothetical protein HYW21_03035 [Candidatus Woesearchaeota archaeon]|nr:hypothetical protein [Candidatus Woesearchaeota archaeon]
MQETYHVQGKNEFLEARLVEESGRQVVLTYRNARGDTATVTIQHGLSTSVKGRYTGGLITDQGIGGYLLGLDRLGPELRAQIPSDWYQDLGNWLASKEHIKCDE